MAERPDGTTGNVAEDYVIGRLRERGFEVVKDGWPDLLVLKDGGFWLLEVKPVGAARLSERQKRMAEALRSVGIRVDIVTPEDV